MGALVLTFHGSVLELLAWIALVVFGLGAAFAAGWATCDLRDDAEDGTR